MPAQESGSPSTFLFADLAGFTATTEIHGDAEAAELAAEFCGDVRALLAEVEADELKTIGDAVMIRSDDAATAVRLGVEIVERMHERPLFPVVHVGMHTGRAVEREGDWFGTAVNLAARVAGAAAGDEVLLTSATRESASSVEGIHFESRGRVRLRNVREPVRLYRALRSGARREQLAIDPVCRMAVAPERSAGHLIHDGIRYEFCSLECAAVFARDPESYVAPGVP